MAGELRMHELLTLKTIAETLNRGTDLEPMLTSAVQSLLEVTGLTTGWIFLVDGQPDFRCAAACNLPPALAREEQRPLREGSCWCLADFWAGELKAAVNVVNCKRLKDAVTYQWGDTAGIEHHATVPLTVQGQPFGILNVGAPGKQRFDADELALLQAVAYQIGTAIERVRLYQQRREVTLVEERHRLARDLHDSVCQTLFSLSLTARAAALRPADADEALRSIQSLAQDALREMRALIFQLRPADLHDGLLPALHRHGEGLGLSLRTVVDGAHPLPRAVEEALWRIGQEALHNVRKHAGVAEVDLRLVVTPAAVLLEIADAGAGCASLRRTDRPHLGMTSMRERAEALGGSLRIESRPGQGTRVTVWIPYATREERSHADQSPDC